MTFRRQDQSKYEAAFPDRFEGADDWIALARSAFDEMSDTARWPVTEFPARLEELRLRAKYSNLAGQNAARAERNSLALGLRGATNQNTLSAYKAALYLIDTYLRDPEKRSPISRMWRDLDLVPKVHKPAPAPKLRPGEIRFN